MHLTARISTLASERVFGAEADAPPVHWGSCSVRVRWMSLERVQEMPREWEVLLLCGASGVGKTSVSRAIARAFDTSLAQADSFRVMLERTTAATSFPALHG